MSEWINCTLGDIAEVIGGGTPSKSKPEYYEGGTIPWITPKDLSGYPYRYIERGENNITELGLAKSSARMLPKGAVLFSSRAPIGYVAIAKNPLCTNQGFKSFICDEKKVNNLFLYYFLKSNLPMIENMANGSTFKEISGSVAKTIPISLPPLNIQEKIVSIIGSLDDKIELNLKMNETLEEMAMTLYKHWFVDFGPFQDGEFVESELGMIPKGWEIKKLSDIVEIRTTSINPSKTPGEFYYHYSIPAYDEGKLPSLNSAESIKSNKYLIETDTVLVSKLNPATPRIWTVYFKKESKNKQITSTEFIHYVPKQNINFAWLNCYLRSDDFQNEFKSNATGTTHSRQRVSPKVTKNFLVVIPPFDVMASFNNKVSSYFKLIDQNLKSITLLSETRDYLLPRLLSGEIDLSKAEKQVEKVL
ncbi:EcoKI restriction-modification system protein HsdS [Geobacillus sp. 12AMOR1]|nr:EcoKI restriction-modification system protein HsdS [Geobacillus sp. 12AMOR1]